MNSIPPNMRTRMDANPFYHICCITGRRDVKIEWHHNLIFAGSQVQEEFAILPIAEYIHKKADYTHVREILDWVMLSRATDAQLVKYSKARNLFHHRDYLNEKFGGPWKEGDYRFENI